MSNAPNPPDLSIVVTRSGGLAGVHDVVEIAADGTARLTTRNAGAVPCTPDPDAVRTLRSIDLAAVAAAPSGPAVMDGFAYEVTFGDRRVTAGDGDAGVRGELVRAAGAVVHTCIASANEAPR